MAEAARKRTRSSPVAILTRTGRTRLASVVALRAPQMHPAGVGRQWYDLQQPQWTLKVARVLPNRCSGEAEQGGVSSERVQEEKPIVPYAQGS